MKYLTAQQVLFIHARLIAETGGSKGFLDLSLLESAIARPSMTFDNQDLYPDVFDKAAALMDSLVNNHPFVDGNKRAGITSAALFLRTNGFRIICSHEELENFTLKIATGHPAIADISNWLKANSRLE